MKKLSIKEKINGELAVRDMCEDARKAYAGSDPLTVAKCFDGTYSIRGIFGDIDGLTFEEVEEMLLPTEGEMESIKTITTIEELMNIVENGGYNYCGLRAATKHDLDLIKSGRDYLDCSHHYESITQKMHGELQEGTSGLLISEYDEEETILEKYNWLKKAYRETDKILLIADKDSTPGYYDDDKGEYLFGHDGYGADIVGYVELQK